MAPRVTLSRSSSRATAPAGAQGGPYREFLLAPFGPYEQQVGDVRTGDEQHQADGRHQDPENLAHIADDIVLERPDARSEVRFLEHLHADAGSGRELLHEQRQHARDVGVGLRERHPGLKPGDRLVAEVAYEDLGTVELERDDDGGVLQARCSSMHKGGDSKGLWQSRWRASALSLSPSG